MADQVDQQEDTSAEEIFYEHLEALLADERTVTMLTTLHAADSKVSSGSIYAEVLGRREQIFERLSTTITAWQRAEEKLSAAQAELEQRAPASTVRRFAGLAVVTVVTALSIIVYLAVSSGEPGILGFSVFSIYVAFPWMLFDTRRNRWARQLAVPIRRENLEKLEERFRTALVDQVTVAIREAINESLTSFSTTFRIFDTRGLRELADPEREVPTAANGGLEALMASLSSGSIGVSGPRGAGKTTLIEGFARGRSAPLGKEPIGVVVSAPVKYDAREFVLHLFGSLCEGMLGDDPQADHFGLSAPRRGSSPKLIAQLLVVFAAVLSFAAIAILFIGKTAPEGPTETAIFLLALAAILGYISLLIWVKTTKTNPLQRQLRRLTNLMLGIPAEFTKPKPPPPERVAVDLLEQIRFQQSISSSWSGGVEIPLGIKLGGEGSVTSARVPWSLPEAVDAFRKYAGSLGGERYIVIGIDELDKMESDDAARQFLNNVKGVFGVKGCYYLVSVSEDAMSSFERRGLPFRDVFDSSFDAIQRVGYLSLDETRSVLESRVTGLPIPFQCLCHCLSGGLARDLIRVTRELVHQHSQSDSNNLGDLALEVVRAEYRGKLVAASEASRRIEGDDREWIVKWLNCLQADTVDAGALFRHCNELVNWPGLVSPADDKDMADQRRRAREIAVEMTVFNYYTATVLEMFGAGDEFTKLLRPLGNSTKALGSFAVEMLAHSRQNFSISPWLAWDCTARARKSAGWLQPWQDPRNLSHGTQGSA